MGEVVVQKFVLAVEAFQALHAFQGNQEVASFHVAAYLEEACQVELVGREGHQVVALVVNQALSAVQVLS